MYDNIYDADTFHKVHNKLPLFYDFDFYETTN